MTEEPSLRPPTCKTPSGPAHAPRLRDSRMQAVCSEFLQGEGCRVAGPGAAIGGDSLAPGGWRVSPRRPLPASPSSSPQGAGRKPDKALAVSECQPHPHLLPPWSPCTNKGYCQAVGTVNLPHSFIHALTSADSTEEKQTPPNPRGLQQSGSLFSAPPQSPPGATCQEQRATVLDVGGSPPPWSSCLRVSSARWSPGPGSGNQASVRPGETRPSVSLASGSSPASASPSPPPPDCRASGPGGARLFVPYTKPDEVWLPCVPAERPPRERRGSQVSCGPRGRRDPQADSLWTNAASADVTIFIKESRSREFQGAFSSWAAREGFF